MIEMSADEDSVVIPAIASGSFLNLMLVEDSPADARLVQHHLKRGLIAEFAVKHVESVSEAIGCLENARFDLILLDLNLPDSTGLKTFYSVFEKANGCPILIMSGNDDSELAVIAVRDGAQDYILKGDIGPVAMGREVRFAIERNNRISLERQLEGAHEQIRVARRLQKGLYPRNAPKVEGFDIGGHAWAAEHACGDYFDFLPMSQGTIGVVVGDVSGHGLGPALKMVETRAALHAFSEYEDDLGKLIDGVHRVFCGGQKFEAIGLFVTLFLGRLNPVTRVLQYSSAGHPAFHLTASGDVRTTETMDYPIGLVDNMSGEETREIRLNSGDIIVIPTDGFYEAGAGRSALLGVDGMMSVVRSHRNETAEEIVKAMYKTSRNHLRGQPQEDDMAAIVIKTL